MQTLFFAQNRFVWVGLVIEKQTKNEVNVIRNHFLQVIIISFNDDKFNIHTLYAGPKMGSILEREFGRRKEQEKKKKATQPPSHLANWTLLFTCFFVFR